MISYEIIIVDNLSSDQTIPICTQNNAKIIETKSNVSEARNIGFKQSKGELILFLDSDQMLPNYLFSELVKTIEYHNYDCLIIPEISGEKSYWERCLGFEKKLKTINNREYPRLFTRSIIESVGGYDPELRFGEDMDLYFRLNNIGARVGSLNMTITHEEYSGIQQQLKKYVYYGENSKKIFEKYPKNRIISQFNLHSTWKTLQLYLNDPLHGVGFILLRSARTIALLYGMVKTQIKN